jgi:glyoxylase-like metal-dependent hydrolase (beta-lactamase superfamily II)
MTRGRLLGTLVVVGALSIAAKAAQAPQAPQDRTIQVDKVKDNLYVLKGGGGNTAVFVTTTGVVVVDAKNPGWGQPILDKIKEVTPRPVTLLINTHTHGDHVSGNVEFPAAVEIVTHVNTKANMQKMDAFKGDKARFLPKTVYKDKVSVGSGKDRIDLYYFGAGHTNGDTFVVFPALRVLHTGDMFAWKDAGGCDRNNGGSCVAFPETLAKAVANLKDVDTIIPGHSPMMTPKDLQEYQRFMADLSAHAQAAMKAGQSVDDAFAAFQVDKYPGYKNERVKAAIQAVYDELKK